MTTFQVTPNWLNHTEEHKLKKKVRAVRDATANCPCDPCAWFDTCKAECPKFKRWVKTGIGRS